MFQFSFIGIKNVLAENCILFFYKNLFKIAKSVFHISCPVWSFTGALALDIFSTKETFQQVSEGSIHPPRWWPWLKAEKRELSWWRKAATVLISCTSFTSGNCLWCQSLQFTDHNTTNPFNIKFPHVSRSRISNNDKFCAVAACI